MTIGALALVVAVAGSASVVSLRPHSLKPASIPGSAHLYVVGSRSTEQRQDPVFGKMDAVLADLSRHAGRARPEHWLADLHALSPAARFVQTAVGVTPLVLVDAVTRASPEDLRTALSTLGLERAALYSNDVGGWLPVDRIAAAAALPKLLSIRAAMPRARSGPVATQGDFAERSDVLRATYPTLSGTGVTVGVLSDSFDCYAVYAEPNSGVPASGYEGYAYNGFTADYATDQMTGALPASVNVLEEADCLDYGAPTQLPFGDEGRAMLQIVHAVAPGASLAFYTAENSEADFADGIGKLAAAGAKVIADDVDYFDEPFYQDGLIAQAVDAVEAQGVAYFSAAGNNASQGYENTSPSFPTLSMSGSTAGEHLLNFDTSGATTTTILPVSVPAIPPGDFVAIVVEWDQPYVTGSPGSPGASSQINLCVSGSTSSVIVTDYDGNTVSCTGPNALGTDPNQIMIVANPANAAGNSAMQDLGISVALAGGSAPGRLLVVIDDDGLGSSIKSFATHSATVQGHPGAAGAAAVGAAFYFMTPRCGTMPAELETYSSQGGAPILFNTSGVRLATPIFRWKPNFVAPDGANDTFLGFTLASAGITGADGMLSTSISECQNDPSFPNFFGTSAAAPHAAGIGALMLQANPALTPTQIYGALQSTALPMGSTTPNYNSGYGFIQADAALAALPTGAPTLSLAATSITVGQSTTLSWSAFNATSCTGSGAWSGTQATSGTMTLSPAAAGSYTYSLSCANAVGASTAAAASLSVTAAAPNASHGGGGALDGMLLLGLAACCAASRSRRVFEGRPQRSQ